MARLTIGWGVFVTALFACMMAADRDLLATLIGLFSGAAIWATHNLRSCAGRTALQGGGDG